MWFLVWKVKSPLTQVVNCTYKTLKSIIERNCMGKVWRAANNSWSAFPWNSDGLLLQSRCLLQVWFPLRIKSSFMNHKFSFSTCACIYDAENLNKKNSGKRWGTSTVLEEVWAPISCFVQHKLVVLKKKKKITLLDTSLVEAHMFKMHSKWN